MNFNANTGSRQSLGRKIKRVSDVNAMGYNPYPQGPPLYTPNDASAHTSTPFQSNQHVPQYAGGDYVNGQQFATPNPMPQTNVMPTMNPYMNQPQQPQMPGVFAAPMVQDMALQYGQQLADTGKSMVKQSLQQYVPIMRLKYYFAVDTKYVITKLGILFFPFIHTDWSVKYEQDGNPIQPRFEVNAPDLYIPAMAYFTYVLVAGLALGMQQIFTPEQIVLQASSALAWWIVELGLYRGTLYVTNIQTSLHMLDLLAYSGYKFICIIASILISLVAGTLGYYIALIYLGLALAFFLTRSLKLQVLTERQTQYYGDTPTGSGGNKRRLYFLLCVGVAQPILSWWLSFHLINNGNSVGSNVLPGTI